MVSLPTPAAARPGPEVLPRDLAQIAKEYSLLVARMQQLGHRVGEAIRSRREYAAEHLRQCVDAMDVLFQKWNFEILYLVAVLQRVRFNELQGQLEGISSRSLSQKLKELEDFGLLRRVVHAERPVRIEYVITDFGRTVADLTIPFVLYLLTQRRSIADVMQSFLRAPAGRVPAAAR